MYLLWDIEHVWFFLWNNIMFYIVTALISYALKVENHLTYCIILYLYSDRMDKKIIHNFLNTQWVFMW